MVGVIGALASIATAIDYFFLGSNLSHALKLPDTLPTGILLIVIAPLLLALAGALFFAGRSSNVNMDNADKNAELKRQLQEIAEQLKIERNTCSALTSENADLRNRLAPLENLPTRIRGLLKSRALSRRDLVEGLGLSFFDVSHTQAVAQAVGGMDDITADGLGCYKFKAREENESSR